MSDDVIVSIGASTDNFDARLESARAEIGRLQGVTATATKRMSADFRAATPAITNTQDKLKLLRTESEKLEKAASLLGPQLGGVVSTLSKLGKVGGAEIGGATAAIVGLGAALGAASAAAYGFGSIVVGTITNIDDMADSLTELNRAALADSIDRIRETAGAVDTLDESWAALNIVLTDSADGPLADVSVVLSAILDGWTRLIAAGNATDLPWWSRLIPGVNDLANLHAARMGIDAINEAAARNLELAQKRQATMQGGTDSLGLTFDFAASATTPATKPKPNTASNRPDRTPAAAAVDSAIMSSLELPGIEIPKSQIDLRAAGLDALAKLDAEYAEKKAEADKAAADAAIAEIERETAARRAAVIQGIQLAGQLASAIANFAESEAQAKVDAAQKGSLAYYYAVRDQFNTHQAAALGMAAINIALGFTQELATKGVIGIGTGAVLAAAGAFEVGTILAQKPPQMLHTGGPMTAPDEYVVRSNEVPTMLTAEGARDRQALADLNAGQSRANRDPVIYLVDESGMSRARQHTKPRPDLGLRIQGLR